MKAMMALLFVLLVTGCASNGQEGRYVQYGQVKGDPVRIPPCNPFHADDLMDWAKELGDRSYHERMAHASVDSQGWVRCRTNEVAGSRAGGR